MNVFTKEWMRQVLLEYLSVLTSGQVSDNQTVLGARITDARLLLNHIENEINVLTDKEMKLDE